MGGHNNKIAIMVLNVNLQCCSCYKKVKKILCKFPQIRDQIYDEKGNKVTITVICCNPEKVRDKLCSEGCGVIKSIEIKEPPKPKPPKPKPHPVAPAPVPVPLPVQECPPPPVAPAPVPVQECPPPPVAAPPVPVQKCPPPPSEYCCGQCYEGHTGGPCYQWYGRPVPPPPCYGNYGYIYGPGPYCYNRGCYVSRCDPYLCSDENATGCSIM
ncbi:chitin-binding lectin 1 [Capsicum annuum]|uniref:chitin-binding lectin 1 n=1 Tax=Capsicum annuum TaxID=4072 RepID=UPI001FB19DB6|nr:chitin-binding lectin 1 [Capsicum annuum]